MRSQYKRTVRPLNELERALKRATRELGLRPIFYRQLLHSEVFVLVTAPQSPAHSILFSKIIAWTRHDGKDVIPCFTTAKKALAAAKIDQTFYKVRARALFEANGDCGFHLNPSSEFDLELSPEDVSSLLTRGKINEEISAFDVATDMIISRVDDMPTATASALSSMFALRPEIHQAYLFVTSQKETGHRAMVIGILGNSDREPLVQAIAKVLPGIYDGNLPIDICFMKLHGNEHSAVTALSIEPFYVRAN